MKLIKLVTQLNEHNLINDDNVKRIAAIKSDIIGSRLFSNILLSSGALIITMLIIALALTIFYSIFSNSFDSFYIPILLSGISLIGLAYILQNNETYFTHRLASIFMIIGKLCVFYLIYERSYELIGSDHPLVMLCIYCLILVLSVVNINIAKSKLDAFFMLTSGIFIFSFSEGIDNFNFSPNERLFLEIVASYIIPIWAFYFAFRDEKFNHRLPLYSFLAATIIIQYISITEFSISSATSQVSLNTAYMVNNFTQNAIYLLIFIVFIFKNPVAKTLLSSWQIYFALALMILASAIASHLLILIALALVYGYEHRDHYVLNSGYILVPVFIASLYYSFDISLNMASLIAAIIGIMSLTIYAVIRFSKFKK